MPISERIPRPRTWTKLSQNVLEHLERRVVLAAAAELLVTIPSPPTYDRVGFDDSFVFHDRLFFTDFRGIERLWTTDGSGPPTLLFNSWSFFNSDDRIGITALTTFNDQFFFFANGKDGDGLYTSDGTVAGTRPVKILRTQNTNVLPFGTFQLNGRLYFFWNDLQ